MKLELSAKLTPAEVKEAISGVFKAIKEKTASE
jgi:hypothetical protein